MYEKEFELIQDVKSLALMYVQSNIQSYDSPEELAKVYLEAVSKIKKVLDPQNYFETEDYSD